MSSQNDAILDIFTKITGCYNLVLIMAALCLNPLITYVCLRSKKLRETSTFKLLTVCSVTDLLCSIPWNHECFGDSFFEYYPFSNSLFYCRWISVYLMFALLQFTSWMLVSISLDRFLSMTIKKWSKHYFAGARPFIYAGLLMFAIGAINFNEVFTAGFSYVDENGTEVVVCFDNPPGDFPWYVTMSEVHVYFGFIGPYGLLIGLNIAIIYKATWFERQQIQTNGVVGLVSKRKAQMTRTVLFITFVYILTSLPSTVVTAYFILVVNQMILNIVGGITFTYNAFNFFILFLSNKLFAKEAKLLLLNCCVKANDIENSTRNRRKRSNFHPIGTATSKIHPIGTAVPIG